MPKRRLSSCAFFSHGGTRALARWLRNAFQPGEQLSDGLPRHRIDHVGRDRRQRLEDEPPLAQSRMRNVDAGLVDHSVARENQVEVEGPRCVDVWTLATAPA